MTDTSDKPDTAQAPIFDMKAAREKFRPAVDVGKKSRKAKHKKVGGAVDRRSLRETGRTKQFNFKSTQELKRRVDKAAAARGVLLAVWMEEAVLAKLEAEGEADNA